MKHITVAFAFVILVGLLAACGPSAEEIAAQTVDAETAVAAVE